MSFDIISMKQRAKMLMKSVKPNPKLIGLIFAVLLVAYSFGVLWMLGQEKLIIIAVFELIYLNFRSCCKWYALKVSREEPTNISDVFCAFKEKQIKIILLGIIKDLAYAVGLMLIIVGIVFPAYWFRFSPYIIKDENIGIFASMKKSMQLLKGHYTELIKLDISNLGWLSVFLVTMGLAGFYVKPYTSIVYAEFYDYLKAQNEQ